MAADTISKNVLFIRFVGLLTPCKGPVQCLDDEDKNTVFTFYPQGKADSSLRLIQRLLIWLRPELNIILLRLISSRVHIIYSTFITSCNNPTYVKH